MENRISLHCRLLVFGKARRRKFLPSSVNDGREQSHDSHARENEQDLQEGLPEKKKKKTTSKVRDSNMFQGHYTPQNFHTR